MTAPAPVPAPPALAVAPAPTVRYLPDLDVVTPPDSSDPYSSRGPHVLRLFGAQVGFRYARLGVRSGDRRISVPVSADDLRRLAADALAKADLLDGGALAPAVSPQPSPTPAAAPTAETGARP